LPCFLADNLFYPKPYFEILEKPVAKIVKRIQPDYYQKRNLKDPLTQSAQAPQQLAQQR
jgi:hypothetical protein